MSSNIKKFDEIAGEMLGILYENFPTPKNLIFIEMAGLDESSLDDVGRLPSEARFYKDTASWLVKAGYIWVKKDDHYYLQDAILSTKALEVLKLIPSSLTGNESIGERLAGAVKTGSTEVLKSAVTMAFSEGVKLING